MLMKFFSLQERSLFSIHDSAGVKLLTRLRFKFIHLNKLKFCHNLRILQLLCVTVEQKLKQQNTFSCVAPFL